MDVHLWIMYLVRYGLERVHTFNHVVSNFRQHPESKTGKEASRFKHEINATFLDLFQTLEAPEFILKRLRANAPLQLEGTDWRPGSHLVPQRLFAGYCDKWVRLYFRDEAYHQARIWLQREFQCYPRLTPPFLRFLAKIFWKEKVLREGFNF